MLLSSFFLSASSLALFGGAHAGYAGHCRSEMKEGRELVERVFREIAINARAERAENLARLKRKAIKASEKRNAPNATPNPKICDNQTAVAHAFRAYRSAPEDALFPKLFDVHAAIDPLTNYANLLHRHLSNETACDDSFVDLHALNEAHIFGAVTMLLTRTPGPLCSVCHRLTEEVFERLLTPLRYIGKSSHGGVAHLLLAHIPSPKTLCSALAPGCHADYEQRAANFTPAVRCLECSACMAGLSVVQHKILLSKPVVTWLHEHLTRGAFPIICSDICHKDVQDWPLNFDYPACMAAAEYHFWKLIDASKELLRPERMCPLELGWCELNEQPNAFHCLRELCEEVLRDHPSFVGICALIPDSAEAADKFTNVHGAKIYKEKKPYHEKFEEKIRRKREL